MWHRSYLGDSALPLRSALLVIAALAILAYIPGFHIPLIADDYPQIQMSRLLGQSGGFHALWNDASARMRMSFFVITYWVDHWAGLDPTAYHAVSLFIHVLCCWLVYALGEWNLIGKKVSLIAACFFAVYEGHQEAVMWYSGLMEALVVVFGIASVFCFIQWLRGRGWVWYVVALLSFGAALFSKESAYIFAGLMYLPAIQMSGTWKIRREWLAGLLPFVLISIACVAWIASTRMGNNRFNDGSFAISPHFFVALAVSFGRLMFVWGLLALIALAVFRARKFVPIAAYSLFWMLVGLVPYSFLLYMNRVPSRHTYLASAGLSFLVAAALVTVWDHLGGRTVLVFGAVILMVNVSILWKKKVDQYRTRALPTEMLMKALALANGPVHIRCYPYLPIVANAVAEELKGTVVMEPTEDLKKNGARCMNYWYKDANGNVREVFVPPSRLP